MTFPFSALLVVACIVIWSSAVPVAGIWDFDYCDGCCDDDDDCEDYLTDIYCELFCDDDDCDVDTTTQTSYTTTNSSVPTTQTSYTTTSSSVSTTTMNSTVENVTSPSRQKTIALSTDNSLAPTTSLDITTLAHGTVSEVNITSNSTNAVPTNSTV